LDQYYAKLESGNSKFETSHRKLLGSIISGVIKSLYSFDYILKDARVVSICEPVLKRMRQDSYWKIRLMCFTLLSNNLNPKQDRDNAPSKGKKITNHP
jgi:hypothetical protein